MGDLEQAIAYALEPMTQRGMATLCAYCGILTNALEPHTCPSAEDLRGMEGDDRKRARSYSIN